MTHSFTNKRNVQILHKLASLLAFLRIHFELKVNKVAPLEECILDVQPSGTVAIFGHFHVTERGQGTHETHLNLSQS